MRDEETALILHEDSNLPIVDVDSAIDYWKNYQDLTDKLLDSSDYQGNKFKKKSAWRKYATAFSISDEIIKEDILRDDSGRVITATYHVKASLKNGRTGIGIGSCSIFDKEKLESDTPFMLRQRFSNPEHDIPSTAHTRAKNRAISDLIGAGEVSAEEMGNETSTTKTVKRGTRPKTRPKPDAPKDNVPAGVDPAKVQDAETTTKTRPPRTKNTKQPRLLVEEEIQHFKKENPWIKKAINFCEEDGVEITRISILKILENILGDPDIKDFDLDEFKECKEILRTK